MILGKFSRQRHPGNRQERELDRRGRWTENEEMDRRGDGQEGVWTEDRGDGQRRGEVDRAKNE